jgi:hypothetical protein
MSWKRRVQCVLLANLLPAILFAIPPVGSEEIVTTREPPRSYGVDQYTVTTVSAVAFLPKFHLDGYDTSGSFGRFGDPNTVQDFFAPLDLPGGAVIDYIGLNSLTDAPFAVGVALYDRFKNGNVTTIGTFSSTVHGWDTDYNASPLGYLWNGQFGHALVLHVQQGSQPDLQYFGWVEVWWRRTVSPAVPVQFFDDVPIDHPFFQFISALANSGITAGCGNNNFCPDSPMTRGQMAVFLAKALGLHWPGGALSGPPPPPPAVQPAVAQ